MMTQPSVPEPVEPSIPTLDTLEQLFQEHHERVYRAAYRVTRNAADAEDVLQTIFVRLIQQDPPTALGPGVGGYLYRAAVNAGLDVLRGRRRSRAVDFDNNADEIDRRHATPKAVTEERLKRVELDDRLRQMLAELSPRAAEIFSLRYFEDHSNTEIARLLGISRTSVAVTLHRTRHTLQKELAREGVTS